MKVDALARRVLASINTDAGHILAAQWVSKRYEEVVAQHRFRHLRRVGSFVARARVNTSTVAVTKNSATVTGAAAAQTAWAGKDLIGRWFRASDAFYEITGQTSSTITITPPYAETTATASKYEILSRFHRLDPSVRWLGAIVHDDFEVINLSPETLDALAPARERTGSRPLVWADAPPDPADAVKRVEVYPFPGSDDVVLRYTYWPGALGLQPDDDVPTWLPEHVLEEGALIDAMRYEAAKVARAGDFNLAAYWRNEYRAQETLWTRKLRDAARTDRTVDDVELLVGRGRLGGPVDIKSARDHVLANLAR